MNIKPMGNLLLVEIIKVENITASGIHMPGKGPSLAIAEVLDVGPGEGNDGGGRYPMDYAKGDLVCFNANAAIFPLELSSIVMVDRSGGMSTDVERAFLNVASVMGKMEGVTKGDLQLKRPIDLGKSKLIEA